MYPNLYYVFQDLFGLDWKFLHFVNSFGFFVALSFAGAAMILAMELRRKESQGLLQSKEEIIVVGKPASFSEIAVNFILGFLFGYKIIGLFISSSTLASNPKDFIFSSAGNLPIGLLLGIVFAGLKWWEKNKQKLPSPEERKIRIWPHDRWGDITIYAAIFGFAGAKIFNSFENWDDFVKNPAESLISFSGLTFYGGLICAALAIWYYAKKHNIGFWFLNDAAAPALMFAYAIGRVGCQVSGDGDWGIVNSAYYTRIDNKVALSNPEEFNHIVQQNKEMYLNQFGSLDKLPHLSVKAPSFLPDWLFAYSYPHNVINEGVRIPGCMDQYCAHLPLPVFPTPFYETVICLILFSIIWSFRKRFIIPGTLFAFYLILNGVERFFIEKIRVNNKYSIFGFHPTQAEIISLLLVLGGSVLWWVLTKRAKLSKAPLPPNQSGKPG
ncbi:MAG TPA: prolipoprotein diacylglyceryl transferase family protein [Puia sp.]|nr:prolipoprotein diacylglyceryl transferase family protein [Puia sp.]